MKRSENKSHLDEDDINDDESYGYDDAEDAVSDIQVFAPGTLTAGEHWGAVYDLSGRKRMGVGIVADGPGQPVVLVTSDSSAVSKKPPRKRQFIGRPRRTWRSSAVEDDEGPPEEPCYIGKREPLLNKEAYHSFDVTICFEGSLTPDSADLENEDAPEAQESPSRPFDSTQLSFALANLLT